MWVFGDDDWVPAVIKDVQSKEVKFLSEYGKVSHFQSLFSDIQSYEKCKYYKQLVFHKDLLINFDLQGHLKEQNH